jgi:hypothetical protein
MSFNKKYLHDVEVLEEVLLSEGSERFYFLYVKTADMYIGSSESIEFINVFVDKFEEANEEFYSLG